MQKLRKKTKKKKNKKTVEEKEANNKILPTNIELGLNNLCLIALGSVRERPPSSMSASNRREGKAPERRAQV